MTEHDRRSLAAFRRERAKREREAQPKCPLCGDRMPHGAAEHERIKHMDLYARRAQRKGLLV